jgi:hypothetical protein
MKKQTKRFMATIIDPEKRAAFKRMMIDAQLQSEFKPKTSKNDREAAE